MAGSYYFKRIPRSRIATFDVFSVGLLKHHVAAMLEFDVTESRKKLRDLRKNGVNITFNSWLITAVSRILEMHPEATAFLKGKSKLIIFRNINISILVEKRIGNERVPIPLVIERTNEKSAFEISKEVEAAKKQELSEKDIILRKKPSLTENLYYMLPGLLRRSIWRIMLRFPKLAFKKMGNAVITSVGMMGTINGWFIHKSVHPISFGIGSVLKKPVVINDEIRIREILNMTVLVDHDLIDGAPMVRFLDDLTKFIEEGKEISSTYKA